MSDCSCEGFTEVVKAGLLEGFFFFLPKESGSRSETKRVKRWMARVQELVTSCLISGPLGLYVCSCLAPPRISHCEKKGGKKSHSRCLEASRRTCVCARINTLSFLCWLASQSPWWGVPGNKSDTRASAHTHTGKCADTNAHTNTQDDAWCSSFVFPLPRLYEVQHVPLWTCWN